MLRNHFYHDLLQVLSRDLFSSKEGKSSNSFNWIKLRISNCRAMENLIIWKCNWTLFFIFLNLCLITLFIFFIFGICFFIKKFSQKIRNFKLTHAAYFSNSPSIGWFQMFFFFTVSFAGQPAVKLAPMSIPNMAWWRMVHHVAIIWFASIKPASVCFPILIRPSVPPISRVRSVRIRG